MGEETEKRKLVNEFPYRVFWPTKTSGNERLVLFSEDEDYHSLPKFLYNDIEYYSNILLNVKEKYEGEIISFNISDLFSSEEKPNIKEKYKLLKDIVFIDELNNSITLNKNDIVEVGNVLLYSPNDIYLTIDLENGNVIFKNAPKNTELHMNYLAFFLVEELSYKEIYPDKIKLGKAQKEDINRKTIEGYSELSIEKKEDVDE
jgi:hypothetical protein